jgi:hypothetical protein
MTKPAAFLAFLILVVSCADGENNDGCDGRLDLYSCENPDVDHLNSKGEPDPCHKDDVVEQCPGQCVPIPPAGWDTLPMLVWMGQELAPDCPVDRAGTLAFEGFMDLADSRECPSCTCDPPAGECELPDFITANDAPLCSGGPIGDILPVMWDGQCKDLTPPVLAESVTIGPLTMTETGCKPSGPPPPRDGAASGKTNVRACRGVAFSPCLDPGLLCVPTAQPPPPGFSQCIFQPGEHACPPTYPEQRIVFDNVDDQRHCSECTCADPEGSTCSSTVSVFADTGCNQLTAASPASPEGDRCMDLGPGTTIQGIEATAPTYEAGTCEPVGGKLVGEVELVGLATLCCMDSEGS